MKRIFFSACALPLLLACGGADESAAGEADATATTYLGAEEFLNNTGGIDQWIALRDKLANDFGNICGDTFCGGDYGNLTPLALNCSVTSRTGKLKGCQYTFGGSYALVDAKTGAINLSAKTFTCKIPVTGTVKNFVSGLLAQGPQSALQRTIPGGTQSIYDSLGGCLP